MRFLRALLLITVSVVASGAPQVLAAALDDCCHGSCEGSSDGKTCPPDCDGGFCVRAHASIVAPEQRGPAPAATTVRTVVLAQASPRLPVVTAGVFHPPRA